MLLPVLAQAAPAVASAPPASQAPAAQKGVSSYPVSFFTALNANNAYEAAGLSGEWRLHHQGGLTGYKGREVFAVPGAETVLPSTCAVAFNPSVTGGGKSEDTVLVTDAGVEVLTRTPMLPELANGRPAIVAL